MNTIWKVKPKITEAESSKFLEYPPLLRQLLGGLNLNEKEKIEKFLNSKYEDLHSPFLFQDMEKCVERIWQAIEKKEKIYIYGDYDADAVTASAVLRQTFSFLDIDVESYIPDRFTEGYGVNLEAMEKIKSAEGKVVITVDCGTNSTDVADWCTKNEIDFIITDHHEIVGELPKAFGLINPKNPFDKYPYHEITGVGVAFKLACGILARIKSQELGVKKTTGWEKWLLDLVAIGTVADCHSLLGENRILVKYGLQVLNKTRWVGLKAICNLASLNFSLKKPDTYTLGFVIAPRLNAAGRLEHASIALNALLETDLNLVEQKARVLEEINTKRQAITQSILSEAREQVEIIKDRKILVVKNSGWSKGVVGLVAGKLAEEFNKPTIVLAEDSGLLTGSARTAFEFDILSGLKFASEFLDKFGGHKQAAGLSLKTENFEKFYQKLLDFAEENMPSAEMEKVLNLDAELTEADLTLDTCNMLSLMEPFGVDNFKPKFFLPQVKILSLKPVGKTQTHLQMKVLKNSTELECIGFGLGFFINSLSIGEVVDIAGELLCEEWNGKIKLKFRVIDIKKSNS